jgi:hypothetical protein
MRNQTEKNLLFILIILLVIDFAVYLAVMTDIAISFAFLSLAIATYFASASLRKAQDALELTRMNVRPFISIQPGDTEGKQLGNKFLLEFQIKNNGLIPANVTSIDITFFKKDEAITNDSKSSIYPADEPTLRQPTIFPGATYPIIHTIDISLVMGKQIVADLFRGEISVRHTIKYKGKNIEYITIQTEELARDSGDTLIRKPRTPQYWT